MHTYTAYVVLCMDLDGTAEKKKKVAKCAYAYYAQIKMSTVLKAAGLLKYKQTYQVRAGL